MLGLLAAVSSFGFVAAWGWFAVRPGWDRVGGGGWPAIFAALAMPLVIPEAWGWVRIAVTVFAITLAAKSYALPRGGARDPAMLANAWRYLVWLVMPPETTWPIDTSMRARVRSRGIARALRGIAKLPVVAVLMIPHVVWADLHAHAFVEAFWALWLCWLAVTAIVDLVSCVPMLFGIDVQELFDKPPLSASPQEFWGRRWNLFVHRFAMRHAFLPLGGRRHPLRATLLVFFGSGLMHDWFVLVCVGRPHPYLGWMTAFFVLHGLAVVAQIHARRTRPRARLPRPLAITLHIAWLTITGPLFFQPLGEVFPPI